MRQHFKSGLVCLGVLAVALACHTPWRKTAAEREAIAQLALMEETIYEPPDAVLLSEVRFSALNHEYAFAGIERIYATSRSCEEIATEYREAMAKLGWIAGSGDCSSQLWLAMHTEQAQFSIEIDLSEDDRLREDWEHLQREQPDVSLYVVAASLAVMLEQP
jgi:hypothetical protein